MCGNGNGICIGGWESRKRAGNGRGDRREGKGREEKDSGSGSDYRRTSTPEEKQWRECAEMCSV